jgi:hypothetical protein
MFPISLNSVSPIKIFIVITITLLATFLRPLLLLLLPFILLIYTYLFNVSISKNSLILLLCPFIFFIISSIYFSQFHLINLFISSYLILIPLFILLSSINITETRLQTNFIFFFSFLTILMFISNSIGFIQFIIEPQDDAFIGIYGRHGLESHTLSLLNFILSVYHFYKYRYDKKTFAAIASAFFMISALFCFFGLGLLVFVGTVLIYNFSLKRFKAMLIALGMIAVIGITIYLIRPQTFAYNIENIKGIKNALENYKKIDFTKSDQVAEETNLPRKLILYYHYGKVYFNDAVLFLFGNGPGAFNSRTSFLLNGDYSKITFLNELKISDNPDLAVKYVYPLWNSKLTSIPFRDGTRNQPFSSFISLLAEYGFVFTFILFLFLRKRIIFIFKKIKYLKENIPLSEIKDLRLIESFLKFLIVFFLINLLTDNYLEYPEIVLLFVFIYKLIELRINSLLSENPIKI